MNALRLLRYWGNEHYYLIIIMNIILYMYVFLPDINECEDPAVSARCVANAECCNLPAHFICKCNRGFEGDGEEECRGTFNLSNVF